MATNSELELAYNYVSQTSRHLYLTGKAGTGKTTFLHRIRAEVPKRMAVVAPTGVAAINAKGVTIHSLFQLPFGVILPEMATQKVHRFGQKKLDLIKGLDLLVIDEISMVRADVLDGIDEVLRRIRRSTQPFGGLQLLMIGDLHQLPPVVHETDWMQMREHYETAYFFGSKALGKACPAAIQLKHIYRQQDEVFIDLLNKVRNNKLDAEVLATLNERYMPDFKPTDDDGYITLTSHNNTARQINAQKITTLAGKSYCYEAEVSGNFPESMYPNHIELEFKVGAQVMFNRNDSRDNLFFNGKIGKIIAIKGEAISVQCRDDEEPVYVQPVTWENRKIELNPETKEVEDVVIGEYTQHPLKLAWAITIHKSQGLTFDKVVIDAADAFAHGQVYVALSRCKTFEGIVLRSRIGESSIQTDEVVNDYSTRAEDHQPTPADLLTDKRHFQLDCLQQFFLAKGLRAAAGRLNRALLENERYLSGGATVEYTPVHTDLVNKVLDVGQKFVGHIDRYGEDDALPEDHAELRQRLVGAADYFLQQLDPIANAVAQLDIISDNAKIQKNTRDRHDELKQELFVADRLLRLLKTGFDPLAFVRARTDAIIDFNRVGKSKTKTVKTPKKLNHPVLYQRLSNWRDQEAESTQKKKASIIATATLLEIDLVLPTSKKSLLRLKSFGATRYERFGETVLTIINDYLDGRDIKTDNLEFAKGAKAKEDTKLITLQLWQAGNDVAQIAEQRKLVKGTVNGHMAYWVGLGDIAAADLVDEAILDVITAQFAEDTERPLKEVHDHFEGKYDYGVLKIAQAHLTYLRVIAG